MNRPVSKGLVCKASILILIGILLSYFTRRSQAPGGLIHIVDALFLIGMVFFIYGMIHLVGNANVFTSLTYGFRSFKNLLQGCPLKAAEMKEEYLEYRNSRKKHDDVPFLLLSALIFMALSVAIHRIFC